MTRGQAPLTLTYPVVAESGVTVAMNQDGTFTAAVVMRRRSLVHVSGFRRPPVQQPGRSNPF